MKTKALRLETGPERKRALNATRHKAKEILITMHRAWTVAREKGVHEERGTIKPVGIAYYSPKRLEGIVRSIIKKYISNTVSETWKENDESGPFCFSF